MQARNRNKVARLSAPAMKRSRRYRRATKSITVMFINEIDNVIRINDLVANEVGNDLVLKRDGSGGWRLGKVIGMSHFHLPKDVGPLLTIMDIETKQRFNALPFTVAKMVRLKPRPLPPDNE